MTAENLISKIAPKSDFDLKDRNQLLENYKQKFLEVRGSIAN